MNRLKIRPAVLSSGEPAAHDLLPAVVVLAGLGLLISRASFTGAATRTTLTVVTFGALLVGSLLIPANERPRGVAALTALAAGLGALGLALLVAPPVPLPPARWSVAFVLLAAVSEEAFFRRALFTWAERVRPGRAGVVVSVLVTAALFAAIHVPLYGVAALPLDLGAGLLFSWQRAASGTWLVPAATHGAANLAAVLA